MLLAIVGGGIGGMEAARILTLRGHKASIYEKGSKLGGVFNAAAAPDFKEADKALLAWYEKQMKELGIDVHFGTEVTKDVIEGETPDAVIVASGAAPRKLSFKGEAEGQVVSAIDFLLGNKAVRSAVETILPYCILLIEFGRDRITICLCRHCLMECCIKYCNHWSVWH